ncbi:MAG: DegV family protein [Acidobacteria bacterium]|nr:DegV family protein [Acidobacteriota bacterium]
MGRVGIVVDSGADLPDDVATAAGISVVPLTIRFGDEQFLDRVTLSLEDFWHRVASSNYLPSTAAPAPGAFLEVVNNLVADGADSVVIVTLSRRLSASFQSATVAAQECRVGVPVRVVDSQSATMGQGLVALAMAQQAQNGASLDHVVAVGESARERVGVLGMLDSLDHLVKGGRIGGARALVGNLLSIKPLLTVRDGVVGEAGRQRTPTRALTALADVVASEKPLEALYIVHSTSPHLPLLRTLLDQRDLGVPIASAAMGPTIGTHAGPGLIGVAWLRGLPS